MATIRKDIYLLAKSWPINTIAYSPTDGSTGISEFDPNFYNPLTAVYFEATFELIDGGGILPTPIGTVRLYNKTDSVSVVTVSRTGGGWYRARSGNISGSLGAAKELFVSAKVNRSGHQISLHTARLIIVQTGTLYKTASYYMIGDRYTRTSTVMAEVTNKRRCWFDANNFDGTIDYFFHATIWQTNVTACNGQLYDTTNTAVKGTITTTSAVPVLVKDITVVPVDDSELTVRIAMVLPGMIGAGEIANAQFIVTQDGEGTPLTKTESPIQVHAGPFGFSVAVYNPGNRKFSNYDPADWLGVALDSDSEFSIRVETGTPPRTAYGRLLANITGIPNSEVNTTSATYVRLRGNSLTEPAANDVSIDGRVSATVATSRLTSSRMIIFLTNIEEAPAIIPTRTLTGTGL